MDHPHRSIPSFPFCPRGQNDRRSRLFRFHNSMKPENPGPSETETAETDVPPVENEQTDEPESDDSVRLRSLRFAYVSKPENPGPSETKRRSVQHMYRSGEMDEVLGRFGHVTKPEESGSSETTRRSVKMMNVSGEMDDRFRTIAKPEEPGSPETKTAETDTRPVENEQTDDPETDDSVRLRSLIGFVVLRNRKSRDHPHRLARSAHADWHTRFGPTRLSCLTGNHRQQQRHQSLRTAGLGWTAFGTAPLFCDCFMASWRRWMAAASACISLRSLTSGSRLTNVIHLPSVAQQRRDNRK